MRGVLLKATFGLSVVASITSMAGPASAQISGYFDLSYEASQDSEPYVPSQICAGVSGGNMTNGTKFITWQCSANQNNGFTGAKDQAFIQDTSDYIESGGFFYYSIRDSQNYGKCMGVSGGSTGDDATVMIWDCLGTSHPDQYWLLFPDEYQSGCYFLYNYKSGMWLGVTLPGGYGGVGEGDTLIQTDDADQMEGNGAPIPWCPHSVTP